MAAFQKFSPFVEKLAEGVFNLQTNVLKAALTNQATLSNTYSVFSDVTEIAATNGYVAGGMTLTVSTSAQTGGTYKLTIVDQSLTATGTIPDFQSVYLYSLTGGSSLIGWYPYGATVTITTGNSFLINFDETNGVIQIT